MNTAHCLLHPTVLHLINNFSVYVCAVLSPSSELNLDLFHRDPIVTPKTKNRTSVKIGLDMCSHNLCVRMLGPEPT